MVADEVDFKKAGAQHRNSVTNMKSQYGNHSRKSNDNTSIQRAAFAAFLKTRRNTKSIRSC